MKTMTSVNDVVNSCLLHFSLCSCSVTFTEFLVSSVHAVFMSIADQILADEFVVVAVEKDFFGSVWELQG